MYVLLITGAFLVLGSFYFPALSQKTGLILHFLDVGNGDAIAITQEANVLAVVDGGPDYYSDYFLSRYFPLLNCNIKYMFLTHPHADHLKGLTRMLSHCEVENVYENKIGYTSKLYGFWHSLLDGKISSISNLVYNTEFTSGSVVRLDNLKIISLYPTKDIVKGLDTRVASANDVSMVLLIDYLDFEALLMADIEAKNQELIDFDLLDVYLDGSLEVLKVPHHGSKNALNTSFFDKLTIDKAIVTTGPNDYGHPSPTVLDYFTKRGVTLLRTDVEGDIAISVR